MKTIEYKVKDVRANTQYRELRPPDRKYLLDKLREISELGNGCINAPEQSLRTIGIKIRTPNKNLPRQGKINNGCMNSIQTAADGILDNIENGTQRDFSNHSCKLIEKTFTEMTKIFNDWAEVEFKEVSSFRQAQPVVAQYPGSTFDDLFTTQVYEVTVTRKR